MQKQMITGHVSTCVQRLAIVIAAMTFTVSMAVAEEIRIGGTGNALGAMHLLADAYVKQHPDTKVTVLSSLGSSGAFKALPKGALEIGLSSRPLTEEEGKLGLVAEEYARTPLVFAVPLKTRTAALTLEQVADIYSGKLASWPDGSAIRPVLRQIGDDNTRQLKAMSPAINAALSAAEQRPGLPFATTDQEAADKMENVPGAVGVTTLSLLKAERRQLRALTLDGVEPTAANIASGKYPHIKPFFMITQSNQSSGVKRFIAYVKSPAGRNILVRAGNWIP